MKYFLPSSKKRKRVNNDSMESRQYAEAIINNFSRFCENLGKKIKDLTPEDIHESNRKVTEYYKNEIQELLKYFYTDFKLPLVDLALKEVKEESTENNNTKEDVLIKMDQDTKEENTDNTKNKISENSQNNDTFIDKSNENMDEDKSKEDLIKVENNNENLLDSVKDRDTVKIENGENKNDIIKLETNKNNKDSMTLDNKDNNENEENSMALDNKDINENKENSMSFDNNNSINNKNEENLMILDNSKNNKNIDNNEFSILIKRIISIYKKYMEINEIISSQKRALLNNNKNDNEIQNAESSVINESNDVIVYDIEVQIKNDHTYLYFSDEQFEKLEKVMNWSELYAWFAEVKKIAEIQVKQIEIENEEINQTNSSKAKSKTKQSKTKTKTNINSTRGGSGGRYTLQKENALEEKKKEPQAMAVPERSLRERKTNICYTENYNFDFDDDEDDYFVNEEESEKNIKKRRKL